MPNMRADTFAAKSTFRKKQGPKKRNNKNKNNRDGNAFVDVHCTSSAVMSTLNQNHTLKNGTWIGADDTRVIFDPCDYESRRHSRRLERITRLHDRSKWNSSFLSLSRAIFKLPHSAEKFSRKFKTPSFRERRRYRERSLDVEHLKYAL